MEKFLNIIYRQRVIKRWGTSYSIQSESVAEHNYYVAILAHILATIDQNMNNSENIDLECLLIKALYHDSFEAYTAHIVSPIKKYNEPMKKSTAELKNCFCQRLYDLIPNEFKNIVNKIKNDNKKINIYMEVADVIDAYCYCAFQVHIGNKDFINKLEIMKKNINQLMEQYNFVKYFLENSFDEENFEIIY